jgi:general secretion pathway protein F
VRTGRRAARATRPTSPAGKIATVLARTLRERGLILLDADASRPARWRSGLRFRPGHKREVLEVTRALASLLPAGLPLAGAMRAAGHMATGEVAEVVEDLRERVQRGESLVDALSEHPDLFPPLYVGVVRAGERSGDLAAAFARLARQLERQHELRSRLLSASIYPLILAALGGLAVVVLLVFVIPRFAELLQGAGASLPRSTAAVLAISSAIRASWPLLAAAAVLGLPLTAWWWSADAGRRLRTRALLSLPVLRGLQRHNLAASLGSLGRC